MDQRDGQPPPIDYAHPRPVLPAEANLKLLLNTIPSTVFLISPAAPFMPWWPFFVSPIGYGIWLLALTPAELVCGVGGMVIATGSGRGFALWFATCVNGFAIGLIVTAVAVIVATRLSG